MPGPCIPACGRERLRRGAPPRAEALVARARLARAPRGALTPRKPLGARSSPRARSDEAEAFADVEKVVRAYPVGQKGIDVGGFQVRPVRPDRPPCPQGGPIGQPGLSVHRSRL